MPVPVSEEHRLSSKASNKPLGQAGGKNDAVPNKVAPVKKKAPKMVIGEAKSPGPFVKEQIIILNPDVKRATEETPIGTVGASESRDGPSKPSTFNKYQVKRYAPK